MDVCKLPLLVLGHYRQSYEAKADMCQQVVVENDPSETPLELVLLDLPVEHAEEEHEADYQLEYNHRGVDVAEDVHRVTHHCKEYNLPNLCTWQEDRCCELLEGETLEWSEPRLNEIKNVEQAEDDRERSHEADHGVGDEPNEAERYCGVVDGGVFLVVCDVHFDGDPRR